MKDVELAELCTKLCLNNAKDNATTCRRVQLKGHSCLYSRRAVHLISIYLQLSSTLESPENLARSHLFTNNRVVHPRAVPSRKAPIAMSNLTKEKTNKVRYTPAQIAARFRNIPCVVPLSLSLSLSLSFSFSHATH